MTRKRKHAGGVELRSGIYWNAPCPFCAHAEPIVATIAGEQPAYIIPCPESVTTRPKQLPGVTAEVAIDAWNRRFGMDH